MAKQLNVNLKVSADTSTAQQALHKLSQSLSAIQNSSSNAFSNLGLENAKMAAKDLQMHLQNAVNVDTGKLDLNKFSSSLVKSNQNLTILSQKLLQGGTNGQQAFSALARSIALADTRAINLGTRLNGLLITLKNTVRWQISSSVLHGFMSAVSGAYTYAQKLNESLTDIQIVTESSSEKMAKFAKEANKAAQALSTTTNTYAKAALIYYQQGLDDKQVKERTDLTIKMANVTGNTAKTVSEQLTAIWNNFDDGSRSLESYIDVITALGASTASSTTEIAEGLEKFAAIARTVGLSYEYATSALATVVAKTRQSADVVGTAFKTLFARIQDLELGKTLDDGTTLGRYSEALAAIGVNIKNANGELKDMDDILDELGAKWDQIDRGTQVAVAQAVGGTRQYQQLIAILDNWDYMQKNLNVAAGSEGTLSRQAEIYAKSWEAAKNRVKASAEEIYKTLLNDQFFISITNGFSKFLNVISELLDGLGGVKGLLLTISSIIVTRYMAELPRLMGNVVNSIGVLFGAGNRQQQKMLNETASLAHAQNLKLNSANTPGYDKTAAQYEADFLERTTRLSAQAEKATKNLSLAKKEEYQNRIRNYQAMGDEIVALQRQGELLNTENKKTIRTLSRQGASYATAHGTTTKSTYQAGKDVEEKLKLYAEKSEQQARIDSFEDSFNNGRKNLKTELDNISTNLNSDDKTVRTAAELDSKNVSTKMLGLADYAEERIKEIKPNHKLTEDQQKAINDFRAEIQAANGDVEKLQNTLANFTKNSPLNSIFRESGRQVSQLSDELTDLEEELKETYGISQKQLNNIYEKASEAGISKEEALRKYTVEKNNEPNVKDITEQNQAGLQQISQIASSLMSIYMLINSIQQLGNIWGDENLTTSEKLLQTLSSMVMILPALSMMFQTTAGKAMVAAVSQGIFKKAIKAAGDEAAKAGTKMWASLGPYLVIVLAVIAAVTALVLVFKALSNWYNKDKIAAEKAAKAAATLAEQYDKIKASYEEMIKAISNYKEAEDALDKLTKGTEEYEKALKNANKQAQALIIKYKLLRGQDYSITDDGRIIIKDTILKRLEDKQEAELNQAEAISNIADNAAAAAANKSKTTNLMREVTGNKTMSGWLWGGIGGALATGALFIPIVGPLISAAIGAASVIGGTTAEAKITQREAGMQEVLDKIIDGTLDISGDLSYSQFKDLLKEAKINVNDDKLIQALYKTRDSLNDLAETEKQTKQTEEQNAYNFARNLFAQDDAIVAAGLTNDLGLMGQRIMLQAEEDAKNSFDEAYKQNGEEITRQYIKANAAALGKDAQYKKKGQYTYTDDQGNLQTRSIDETALKFFYQGQLAQEHILKNENEILKTYNLVANNPYLKAMVVSGNFNSLTRDQWIANAGSSITPEMLGLQDKSKNELDTFAQNILGAKSWNDWVYTINEARQATANAWGSFNGHAVENIIDSNNNISLKTAQNFKNILDQFAKAPQYEGNVTLITNGINQLANGSKEALEALSALDYTSPEIGNQIRNTLINLGVPISLTNDAFNNLIDTIKSVSLAVPSYQTLYTTLNQINNVIKNLKFGSIIKKEEYDQLIQYNAALAQYFQMAGQDQYRFNSLSTKNAKQVASDMARAQLDAAYASAEAGRVIIDNGYTPEVTMASGLEGNTRDSYIKKLIDRWSKSGVFDLDVVKNKGFTAEFLKGASDEQIQAAIKYVNDLAAAGMNDTALREAREIFASTIDNIDDLNDALKTGALTQNEYDKQLEYIINHAKDALSVVESINKALEYQNKLLDRQATITDTLYGGARLAALEQERNILAQNAKLTEKKIQQLQNEVTVQAGALAMKGVTFGKNGQPNNLDELYWKGIITDEERSKYLEVFNNFLDAQDDLLEIQIKRQEKYYQKLTEALENQLELIEMDRTKLKYDYGKIEDDVYKAAEGFGLLKKQQDLTSDSLKLYKDQLDKIQNAYAAGDITSADYADGLKKIYNSIYDNMEAFDDLDEQMREYYTNTLSKINDELDKYISKIEYLTDLTDHYKSIITLISGENDYDRLGLIYAAASQNAQNNLSVALERQRAAKEQLEFLRSQPAALAEDIEAAEKQVQETTNAVFEATQDLLEVTKETALNNIKKVGAELEKTLTGGSTFDRINQSISMRSKYAELFYTQTNQVYETQKRINQVEQEIAKTTNKAYSNELKLWKQRLESAQKQEKLSKNQLALMDAEFKLIQARAAFEEAQNAKSTVRLTRDAEGNYGYVFTADQENITKAQQAVQDAENELYNKQLEIANKNAEQIVQIQQEMFNKIQEINTDLTLSVEERELRIQEIYQQYSPYILALTNDRNMAISYSEENTAKIMRDAWSNAFQTTIDNCSNWTKAYNIYSQQCAEYLNQWYAIVDQITQQVGLDFDSLKDSMKKVSDESKSLRDQLIGENGLVEALNQIALQILSDTSTYAGLRDGLLQVAEGYAQVAQECRKALAEMQAVSEYSGNNYNKLSPKNIYWNADDKGNLNIYDADTGDIISSSKISNESLQLKKAMESLKEKAKEEGLSDDERSKRAEQWKAARDKYNASLINDAESIISNNKYMNIIDDEAWNFNTARNALLQSSVEHSRKADEYRDKYIEYDKYDNYLDEDDWAQLKDYRARHSIEDYLKRKYEIGKEKFDILEQIRQNHENMTKPILRGGGGGKFDTGGYTGKWGPEGKLATLHEKELVLNKQDTQNILAAVSLIRQIASAIDLQALMQSFGLLSVGATKIGTLAHTNLEQKVEIIAQFPNAIYHDEIKEAFDTLINRASQYANRNY